MGVTGLWRLLEPAGSPVHLDSLRGRVLAVDISIWLHQMVKGFQDAKGAAIANSHLYGLFQRLCKLLYYGIKPIFVFDGCFPVLKRQTIINRQNKKASARNSADKIQQQLMEVIAKHIAVKNSLTGGVSPTKSISPIKKVAVSNEEDLFKLPSMQEDISETASNNSEEEEEVKESVSSKYQIDLHSFDVDSEYFKNLDPREKHDLLTELKETRKASSWGRLHELPSKSQDFSDYQMKRLLKRRQVQVTLEETEKEIGGNCLSINELEILLNEEGIDTKISSIPTRQIASNENAHFLLIKDVKEAMKQAVERESAKKKDENESNLPSTSKASDLGQEYDEDLEAAIKLSLEVNKEEVIDLTEKSDPSKSILVEGIKQITSKNSDLTMAKAYMLEYSGLSEYEIDRILNCQASDPYLVQNQINTSNFIEIESNKKSSIPDKKLDIVHEPKTLEPLKLPDTLPLVSVSAPIVISDTKESSRNKIASDEPIKSVEFESNQVLIEDDALEEKKLDSNNDALSTSSDDSFEEVPEVKITKNSIPNNDIFADVFIDESKFQALDTNILSNLNSKLQKSEENFHTKEINSVSPIEKNVAEAVLESNEESVLNLQEIDTVIKVENESDDDKSETSQLSSQEDCLDNPKTPMRNEPILENDLIVVEQQKNNPISMELLADLERNLEKEQDSLQMEQNKLDRMGRNITDEMTKDAQNLLRLFGVPYIVAPTEAEAQCAFLESVNLTDGTITDDSDIWLFGGKTVYRNFFNQQKHVLKFASDNINRSFKLQREDLILLALLVGSDYTMGVTGVGPVTALEILAAFPRNKTEKIPPYHPLTQGLKKFREWCYNTSNYTHTSLRSKLKNISLMEEFPNIKVIEAYLSPEVEKSEETFSWGTPDVAALRDYTKEKFGWSREKTDEILNPVLKRLNIKSTQLSLKSFFETEFHIDAASDKMSKRVRKAVENLNSEKTDNTCEQSENIASGSTKNPKKRARKQCDTSKIRKDKPKQKSVSKIDEINFKVQSDETIPQRERDKTVSLKNKMKAIELFRKSKQGPGFVKKRKRTEIQPKDEAELSESSSSD